LSTLIREKQPENNKTKTKTQPFICIKTYYSKPHQLKRNKFQKQRHPLSLSTRKKKLVMRKKPRKGKASRITRKP